VPPRDRGLAERNIGTSTGCPRTFVLERDLKADDEVVIDREKFRQVVINLVENAGQALKDPAWDAPEDHERRITVRTESAGPHVRLRSAIPDPAIPAHLLPRIFEPLFTDKSFGIGLGLPTVRQIVEQHGGTLHVESAADAGTTFTVFCRATARPGARNRVVRGGRRPEKLCLGWRCASFDKLRMRAFRATKDRSSS